ncbi:hypothetical protein RZN22_08105 [Bacillaceae bacterium S4-13-58]
MKEAGEFRDSIPDGAAFLGVLSLDGSIKAVDGMLPAHFGSENNRLYHFISSSLGRFPTSTNGGVGISVCRDFTGSD